MRKLALCVVCIMLATSFMGIFSIECSAASIAEESDAVAGIAVTTVSGLFLDVQQSTSTVSFTAIRIHYWTTGVFRHDNGVINFKSCTGGMIIGPISLLKIGLLHNLMFGIFTFLGDINYNS